MMFDDSWQDRASPVTGRFNKWTDWGHTLWTDWWTDWGHTLYKV